MSFADLGLLPELLRAVTDAGYTDPTPIQAKAIPIVLQGHDVMGGAQTGTGKTAGFTLPLLQKLARHANSSPSPAKHPVRALILAPTRELAMQVHENVVTYSKHLPLRSTCIYGGVDMKAQIAELKEGREIIVATPGRLLDHVQQKTVNFSQVEMLVLDEADRMLDMGFIPDIKRILALLPKERQSLLFSATFSDEIKKLADTMLKAPQLIEVAKRNTVSETITHRMHPVATDLKRSLLTWLIQHNDLQQALVFCGTKFGASRIASYLSKQGITADAIHGDKSQNERTKALEAFKAGTIRILVATDVAARGIDIDELPTVINYELPHTAEDYVHRIGRTGRAGKKGEATSLVAPEEAGRLADIEKLIKLKIERVTIDGFDQSTATRSTEERGDGKRERGGRGERTERRDAHHTQGERGERRPRRPEQDMPRRIPHMDAASAHLPKLDFDPNKPYESRSSAAATAEPGRAPSVPARSRKAPVAALLGGFKPKV
ncbi:MAG: DEAD/DEAH box helicase [Rhodocyclaceae bacterium]|nr:DEAD/DEAH box helicase [Rhodocyclaceae bacterium]